jgi:hypothetical protein
MESAHHVSQAIAFIANDSKQILSNAQTQKLQITCAFHAALIY